MDINQIALPHLNNIKPYVDHVPLQSVILWGFLLTHRSCLNKATRLELKRKYSELDEDTE